MFFPGSRYINMTQYQVPLPGGATVAATTLPLPVQPPLQGSFPRQNSQRLDQIAFYFLSDATAFWQLCNANNTPVPDALAAQPAVGIPLASS